MDLLTTANVSQCISDPRDHLHIIVKSCFPNCTMKKYRLYEKVMKVKSQTEPRKSRRRRSSGPNQLPGNVYYVIVHPPKNR